MHALWRAFVLFIQQNWIIYLDLCSFGIAPHIRYYIDIVASHIHRPHTRFRAFHRPRVCYSQTQTQANGYLFSFLFKCFYLCCDVCSRASFVCLWCVIVHRLMPFRTRSVIHTRRRWSEPVFAASPQRNQFENLCANISTFYSNCAVSGARSIARVSSYAQANPPTPTHTHGGYVFASSIKSGNILCFYFAFERYVRERGSNVKYNTFKAIFFESKQK